MLVLINLYFLWKIIELILDFPYLIYFVIKIVLTAYNNRGKINTDNTDNTVITKVGIK